MQPERSEVLRNRIEFFPLSNTEVNVERLPANGSLRQMALCYREGQLSPAGRDEKTTLAVLTFSLGGALYASLGMAAPQLIQKAWQGAQQVEGLPVAGGMLVMMLSSAGLLSLVFVPSAPRLALGVMSLPIGLASAANVFGYRVPAEALGMFASVAGAIFWKGSIGRFHEGWLTADSRYDVNRLNAWRAIQKSGWRFPQFRASCAVLYHYLTYGAANSGAAGVWVAPSSLPARIAVTAAFAGVSVSLASLLGQGAAYTVAGSLAMLLPVFTWVFGSTTWLSEQSEKLLSEEGRTWWERNVDRLSQSNHVTTDPITGAVVRESDHLFLGFEPVQNFPILLHKKMLYEHTYIVGRTGSGKTSMGMMQLLLQIIRGSISPVAGEEREKTPIVIIDLKGDEVLFQTARIEAERRGQKFRFFTLEPGKATHKFNPFRGFRSKNRTIAQLVQLVLDSLGVNHGDGYGRGYYSQRSRFLLSQTLRAAGDVNSFKDLYVKLRTLYGNQKADFRDAFELLSVIESLTHYDQLVTSKVEDSDHNADTIQMDRVLEESEVVYFWLPSQTESIAVREVGKLVLFNLRTAAQDRESLGEARRQAFVFIDECQKLVGENFQEILQKARSGGIAVVLANQSLNDLKTPDFDLRPTIRTNANAKMFFSMNEPEEVRNMMFLSGEELQTFGRDEVEGIRSRLSVRELMALSDHPKRLLLHVTSGSGYTQFAGLPVPVETDWPISKAESEERAKTAWPKLSKPEVKREQLPRVQPKTVPPRRKTPIPKERVDQINRMFEEE